MFSRSTLSALHGLRSKTAAFFFDQGRHFLAKVKRGGIGADADFRQVPTLFIEPLLNSLQYHFVLLEKFQEMRKGVGWLFIRVRGGDRHEIQAAILATGSHTLWVNQDMRRCIRFVGIGEDIGDYAEMGRYGIRNQGPLDRLARPSLQMKSTRHGRRWCLDEFP